MKYEPQIGWANTYDVKLDAASSGLARNGSIYLLSTPTSNLSRPCPTSTRCTSYDRKNWTNSIHSYRLIPNNTSCLSVSFKLILSFLIWYFIFQPCCSFHCHGRAINFLLFCTRYKQSKCFQIVFIIQIVLETIWINSDCLVWQKFPFLFITLYCFDFFTSKKKN